MKTEQHASISTPSLQSNGQYLRLDHAKKACDRIPPVWPLRNYVAVNPFLGLADRSYEETCHLMSKVTAGGMLMDAAYFARQHADGRISVQDLVDAVRQTMPDLSKGQSMHKVSKLIEWANQRQSEYAGKIPLVCEVASVTSPQNWACLMVQEVSKFCAAYQDEGSAMWGHPWKHMPLYLAWKQNASLDMNPELCGYHAFRSRVRKLPASRDEAIQILLGQLGVPEEALQDYLHALLLKVRGWAATMQYKARQLTSADSHESPLMDLLTILLAFEAALFEQLDSKTRHECERLWKLLHDPTVQESNRSLLIWQMAFEIGFQRRLCKGLTNSSAGEDEALLATRPAVQAVFCIDVRSEIIRRALEQQSPEIQTIGFAGFFGMPVEFSSFGGQASRSQVPVLLKPQYRVMEHLAECSSGEEEKAIMRFQRTRKLGHAWNSFKESAVSCFSFVESAGISFAWPLVRQTFPALSTNSGKATCRTCFEPNLNLSASASNEYGIPLPDQIKLAYAALKNMGLTRNFARLVLLCGHGSHTVNNPYAAALDCGACGGHAGDVNARLAASLLNSTDVRKGLAAMGLNLPEDVYFLAGFHNTTTDEVTLFDADKAPRQWKCEVLQLELWLEMAASASRRERSTALGVDQHTDSALKHVFGNRSKDWSQIRPEWGLAGNAAFIAAPRHRTHKLNLHGRVFLHSYSAAEDPEKSTLELILTAPMVVAHWINMQYYASTVNHDQWGSGDKTIHNVTGRFGIVQGNGGDLQTGLPLQSLHNGHEWVHEPLRLSVFVEAAPHDIDAVLRKHENVRLLVDNQWLHLFALVEEGSLGVYKRERDGVWTEVYHLFSAIDPVAGKERAHVPGLFAGSRCEHG